MSRKTTFTRRHLIATSAGLVATAPLATLAKDNAATPAASPATSTS